ncbi:MAG: heme-binding protein [Candidatus Hydrogenedentes bacterium]|nr:heme-binding protein [Candidatus Hydrogenedentota bacterium]
MRFRPIRIVAVVLVLLVLLLFGAWIGVGYASVAGIETPKYKVAEKRDGYEIRVYEPLIVAEVTVEGPQDEALNRGFRKIADYIFGNNTKRSQQGSEKIAMTAPVLEQAAPSEKIAMTAPVLEQGQAGKHIVSFVMPSSYTMDTLPKPNNSEINIREVPERKCAVLRFSGYAPEKKSRAKKEQLLEYAKRDGLEVVGEPILAQYNPPWTPPFMRRNEVLVEIR